jgi:hypothetical protein
LDGSTAGAAYVAAPFCSDPAPKYSAVVEGRLTKRSASMGRAVCAFSNPVVVSQRSGVFK